MGDGERGDTVMIELTKEQEEALSAADLIARLIVDRPSKPCLTCSFQAEDLIVLHMLRAHAPEVPVLFLDTGYHFPETYSFRDRMVREWKLNLRNLLPRRTVAQQETELGILYRTDPTRCCALRKVEPLMAGLNGFDLWFTGLRREQSPTRRNLQKLESHTLPNGQMLRKINPLADWTWEQVWQYTVENRIPYLPLYDFGYRSIGCAPCTTVPLTADPRSGRWGGKKLECGIHTFSQPAGEP